MERTNPSAILSGAAFLMAVSAIGPGFLTQTTQFTVQLGASLAFAILISIIIDIGAQLNTWRVICISAKRGHQVADAVIPGLGWVVTGVIVFGSFVFNVGNISGCALGLESLFGVNQLLGASLSALIAVALFLRPGMMTRVDWFSKVLGAGMILMTGYIVVATRPPLAHAAREAVLPQRVDFSTIVTLVGGTIGGYIMFSGAHRLLDAGLQGVENTRLISRASIRGIVITGLMRFVLFLAVLGVAQTGAQLSRSTPVFDAFRAGAGRMGFALSGLVFWSAAITSVVGCSYTSISFLRGQTGERAQARWIIGFIILSLAAVLLLRRFGWQPTPLLIAAGTINGVLMPVILGVILVAAYRPPIMGAYRHPWWAGAVGALAWSITLFMAYRTVRDFL